MSTNIQHRIDRARRRRREGMTLVEIMIVVIIMALIATAVGVAVLPALGRARVNQARSDAQAVRSAVVLYHGTSGSSDCPSMEELVDGHFLDRGRRTTDPWDHAFVIECEDEEVYVRSNGPDGQPGTEDDVE